MESEKIRGVGRIDTRALRERQKAWDDKLQEMLKPDVYGYVLDQGVLEVVVALNLLGIRTTQSDQGNYGDTPTVNFEAALPEDVYVGESQIKARIMQELGVRLEEIREDSPAFNRAKQVEVEDGARKELEMTGAPYTPEFTRWRDETRAQVEKLQEYIDSFYAKHGPAENADDRLAIVFPYQHPEQRQYTREMPALEIISLLGRETKTAEEAKLISARRLNELDRFASYLKDMFLSRTET